MGYISSFKSSEVYLVTMHVYIAFIHSLMFTSISCYNTEVKLVGVWYTVIDILSLNYYSRRADAGPRN